MAQDLRYRRLFIINGISHFLLPQTKGDISLACTDFDIEQTIEGTNCVLKKLAN